MGINLHGPQTTDHRPQTTDGHTLNLSYYLTDLVKLFQSVFTIFVVGPPFLRRYSILQKKTEFSLKGGWGTNSATAQRWWRQWRQLVGGADEAAAWRHCSGGRGSAAAEVLRHQLGTVVAVQQHNVSGGGSLAATQ